MIVSPTSTSQYTLIPLNLAFCRTDTLTITVVDVIALDELRDTTLCHNDSVIIGKQIDGVLYNWSTGENTPFINVTEPGIYSLTISQEGCEVFKEITVDTINCDTIIPPIPPSPPIEVEYYLFIPNAIAIASSSNNNELRFNFSGIAEISFLLYNRWGKKIWSTNDITKTWSPISANEDYSQILTYYITGSYLNGKTIEQIGTIQIIK